VRKRKKTRKITRAEFAGLIHTAIRNEHPTHVIDRRPTCSTCNALYPCYTIYLLNCYDRDDFSPFYRTAAAASADYRNLYRRAAAALPFAPREPPADDYPTGHEL
jgi:hypothetical protein